MVYRTFLLRSDSRNEKTRIGMVLVLVRKKTRIGMAPFCRQLFGGGAALNFIQIGQGSKVMKGAMRGTAIFPDFPESIHSRSRF